MLTCRDREDIDSELLGQGAHHRCPVRYAHRMAWPGGRCGSKAKPQSVSGRRTHSPETGGAFASLSRGLYQAARVLPSLPGRFAGNVTTLKKPPIHPDGIIHDGAGFPRRRNRRGGEPSFLTIGPRIPARLSGWSSRTRYTARCPRPARLRSVVSQPEPRGDSGSASAVEPPRITNRSRRRVWSISLRLAAISARDCSMKVRSRPPSASPGTRKSLRHRLRRRGRVRKRLPRRIGAYSAASHLMRRAASMDLSAARAKIAAGILPRGDWEWARTAIRPPGRCQVCDEPTTPADLVVECCRAALVVTLHPDCFVMWDEARKLESSGD